MNRDLNGFFLQMGSGVKQNFRLDFSATLLFSLFNVVFNQFFIPVALRHGADNLQVGLLVAAPTFGLLLSPIWAGLAEKRDPKPFVIYPNLLGRFLILLPLFFDGPWMYVLTSLVINFLLGVQYPAYATLISRMYPAEFRGRLMGYVRVAMGGLMIPLAYLVGLWIDAAGETGPLLAAAATGMLSITVFSKVKQIEIGAASAAPSSRTTLKDQIRLLKEKPELTLFFAVATFAGLANGMANPLYQIIQIEQLGLNNVEIGYTRMVYFFFLLVSYLVFGWVIDRYSPAVAIFVSLCCYCFMFPLYGSVGTFSAVCVAFGLQGVADAIWEIGCLAYILRLAPGKEGIVFAIHLMLMGFRGTLGPFISTGLLQTFPIADILWMILGCALIGVVLSALGIWRRKAAYHEQKEG